MAGFYDFKGRYLEIDLDSTIEWNKLCSTYSIDFLDTSMGARYFRISADTYLCRKMNISGTGYERSFVNSHLEELTNDAMDILNSFTSKNYNLLSTLIKADCDRDMIVEAGSRMNVIHLYSVSGKDMKSIFIGRTPFDIEKEELKDEEKTRKCFYELHTYDNFFAALYFGCTLEEFDSDMCPSPSVLLFDWDGHPIARVDLPSLSYAFDIDVKRQTLYAVDAMTDMILKFDISSLPI